MDELPTSEPATPPCWRCSLPVTAGVLACPHCGAPLWSEMAAAPLQGPRVQRHAETVTTILVVYGIMLLISVILGAIGNHDRGLFESDREVDLEMSWWQIAIFEGIDTAIVLACWLAVKSWPPLPSPSRPRKIAAWALAIPVLALALGVNFGYHAVLQDFLMLSVEQIHLVDLEPRLRGWWILVICVQPAIVEEFFFRSLAFRALLPHLSGGWTVLVTSIAFGLAHIYSPLSVPVLTLLGAVFGCATLMTGRIWLSMLLHFCHNLVVTTLD